MKQEDPAIVLRKRNTLLKDAIHHHVLVYGWSEVAKVLREVIEELIEYSLEDLNANQIKELINRPVRTRYDAEQAIEPAPHWSEGGPDRGLI